MKNLLILLLCILKTCNAESINCKIRKIKIEKIKCPMMIVVDKHTNKVNVTASSVRCRNGSISKNNFYKSKTSESPGCGPYVFKLHLQLSNDNKVRIIQATVFVDISFCPLKQITTNSITNKTTATTTTSTSTTSTTTASANYKSRQHHLYNQNKLLRRAA